MILSDVKMIARRVKSFYGRIPEAWRLLAGKKNKYIDLYADQAPNPQNILDLFEDEWASKFPSPYEHLKAGHVELFNDQRILWALEVIGDIKGNKILELGPLEGGHAYTLQKHGASVISIEANPRAFLKCLAVKQMLNLDQVEFLYGDFTKYLEGEVPIFDLCVACGVLYHMRNPVELIAQVAKCAPKMFMWTHYYDSEICKNNLGLKYNLKTSKINDHQGFKHTLYQHQYGFTGGKKFFGGPAAYSNWLSREDILEACKHFGFNRIDIAKEFDSPDHIHGPAFAFFASKY